MYTKSTLKVFLEHMKYFFGRKWRVLLNTLCYHSYKKNNEYDKTPQVWQKWSNRPSQNEQMRFCSIETSAKWILQWYELYWNILNERYKCSLAKDKQTNALNRMVMIISFVLGKTSSFYKIVFMRSFSWNEDELVSMFKGN